MLKNSSGPKQSRTSKPGNTICERDFNKHFSGLTMS